MTRKISKEHIDAYKNGIFKKLFEVITEDPELSFEIRMKNEVMVYYHKDKILTTTIKKGKPTITILSDKYYKEEGKNKPTVCFDKEHIDHNLISKTEMRNYFKEAKKLVYVYKMGAEFSVQQNIALGNHIYDKDHRFLVVDMEWMYSQAGIPEDERMKTKTRIDLIIVDTKKGSDGYNDIYLAELKLGLGATEGKSGTIDHVIKTNIIIEDERACNSLIEDVSTIIVQKEELGLIKGHKDFHFGKKPKMMLIMFYRGKEEETKLEEECKKAKQKAFELGMEEPLCIKRDALIKLDYPE